MKYGQGATRRTGTPRGCPFCDCDLASAPLPAGDVGPHDLADTDRAARGLRPAVAAARARGRLLGAGRLRLRGLGVRLR